jgi:hypothetical protein
VRLPHSSQVDLLPLDDPEWDWKQFERFCLGFVRALPDVVDANLYGTRGQAQLGIDIEARLTDGRTRTYQCRKWQSYTRSDAENTVAETTYEADEHVILVCCEVGTPVRDYIRGLDGWSLKDKEDVSREIREIEPRERARRLIEDTFTVHWRRAFLGPSGPLAFWETDDYFRWSLDPARLFRHTWELVGRDAVVEELERVVTTEGVRVAVLVGRGGIGKTRVLRELCERQAAHTTVLIADENVPLTAEAVDELPWIRALIVVDDAHRREDLNLLLGATRRRDPRPTLLLASRPQGVEGLRSLLAQAGFGANEVWFSEPMSDLAVGDVEALGRQALGPEHRHLVELLARATADCPLVTVIGGQLLAQRAVAPELLEREADFREEVLNRFRDEMLGRIGDDVDPAVLAALLVLIAALAPVSVDDEKTLAAIADELRIDVYDVSALFSRLEEVGLLLARGRLRRIVPDVLADHILHRACVDRQGRPTGRADALLSRYGASSLGALLRNLAELDWRIGQTAGDVGLLARFWRELHERFVAADAEARLRILELVERVAALAPGATLEVTRTAMTQPAEAGGIPALGYEVTDDEVRRALPPLLGRVALTPTYLSESLQLL